MADANRRLASSVCRHQLRRDYLGRKRGRVSDLPAFHFPRTVVEADLIVSMPKLKTHHCDGLHCCDEKSVRRDSRYSLWLAKKRAALYGIPETIYDINASVPRTIGIIDALNAWKVTDNPRYEQAQWA